MKIGFIGLGHMGTVIAENLVDSGREFSVYNSTASKTKPLTDKGAKVYPSVEALGADCNIIISIVSDDAALKSVSEALLNSMQSGGIHISMSTILPQTAEELASLHTQKG